VPVGKITEAAITSSWNAPSFTGEFLPTERVIKDNGFSAQWKVIDVNRNFPQQWISSNYYISSTVFGVKLFKSVDLYQKVMRTVKYAIMFIGLTFLVFFMIEVLNQENIKKMHPIRYLLIGSALVLFYSLLLSLSEHIGFLYAYVLASLSVIILITLYSRSVLVKNSLVALIAGVLSVLYVYLYVILQLEDYALLIGSISIFSILGLVMYLTRNLDWSRR
jgi:inner membrane protein